MSPIKSQRQECIIITRCVGWMTPVKSWNNGKRAEFADRRTYEVKESEF